MAKLTLTDIAAGFASITTINANNALIEAALEKTLSRDGTSPNTMSVAMDLNSQLITNVLDAINNQDAVTLKQLNAASVVVSTAAATAVTIVDAGGHYVSTTVEAALAEVFTLLASTANAKGASLIGIEDSGGLITATEVEAALAELATALVPAGVTKVATEAHSIDTSTTLVDDNHLFGWNLVANKQYSLTMFLAYSLNVGDIKFAFQFSSAPVQSRAAMSVVEPDGTIIGDYITDLTTAVPITTVADASGAIITLQGGFETHATVGGTLDFQWAQNESSANATVRAQDAWIEIRQLN